MPHGGSRSTGPSRSGAATTASHVTAECCSAEAPTGPCCDEEAGFEEDYEEEEEEEEEEEAPLTSLDWLFSVVPITLGIDDEGRPRGGAADFLDRVNAAHRYALFNIAVVALIGVTLWFLSTETPGPVLTPTISRDVALMTGAVFLGVLFAVAAAVVAAHQCIRQTLAPRWAAVAPGPEGPDSSILTTSGALATSAPEAVHCEEAFVPKRVQRRFVFALLMSQVVSAVLLITWSWHLGLERNSIVLIQARYI